MNNAQTKVDLPDDVVLRVDNVSKKFCRNLKRSMWYGVTDLAKNFIGGKELSSVPSVVKNLSAPPASLESTEHTESQFQPSPFTPHPSDYGLRPSEFWALKNISFELKRGESLGVIGVNGCGKSTLFRVIAGIFPPDVGSVAMRGRLGALIALGAGFHPHLTGRENVYLNGTILGISRAEIQEKLEEIVEFAEIGDFMEAPVSTYSSGMRVRLGFSVAIHMSPDILLIDEVLAVGDLNFQHKCMRHLRKLLGEERTVLFVSHNMANVRRICSRVIYIDNGRVFADGKPNDVIGEYLRRSAQVHPQEASSSKTDECPLIRTHQSDFSSIDSVTCCGQADTAIDHILYKDDVTFIIRFKVLKNVSNIIMELLFFATHAECLVARTAQLTYTSEVGDGDYVAKIKCSELNLLPGEYLVHVAMFDHNTVLSMLENACRLRVVACGEGPMHNRGGFCLIAGQMSVAKQENGVDTYKG